MLFQVVKNLVKSGGKPKVTRAQMLAAVPVRNSAVTWAREARDDRPEVALLRIPRRSDRFGNVIARLFQMPDSRKLELDEIGSDVWEMCDGARTVEAIARSICDKYRLNRRQSETSVVAYLKSLHERNLVALTVKSAAAVSSTARPAATSGPAKGTGGSGGRSKRRRA